MRFSLASALVVALAAEGAVASTWFSKAAYNKWHETELERWLSDHNVPYPTPADRKDLVDLVNKNWEDNVASPYKSWDTNQLYSYLSTQGEKVAKGAEKNKDGLLASVKSKWHETAEQASDSYGSVQNWIFDSWTDSQIKSFLDYHGIPNPSPRTRDSLLHAARSNYQSAAKKLGETSAYPGNWLYEQWSESDLKAWLDERGIPAPQPSSRDKLVATIRRNARVASNKAAAAASSASSSAAGALQSVSDQLLNSWSDSQIKEWADKNGIKVPQGSKRNELIALARKHSAKLTGNNVASSASSYFGAATSSAGNEFAKNTDSLYNQGKYWYDWTLNKLGVAGEEAKQSLSSASVQASLSLSSASSVASRSASSASVTGGKSASSAASAISKSASSASGAAAKSASSASGAATKSASSASGEAAKSVSSASDAAAESASSASKKLGKSGASASSAAKVATDYAAEAASSAKHKASEVYQKATDKVKEEL